MSSSIKPFRLTHAGVCMRTCSPQSESVGGLQRFLSDFPPQPLTWSQTTQTRRGWWCNKMKERVSVYLYVCVCVRARLCVPCVCVYRPEDSLLCVNLRNYLKTFFLFSFFGILFCFPLIIMIYQLLNFPCLQTMCFNVFYEYIFSQCNTD